MVTEENVVTLIVECNNTSSFEFGIMRKQASKKTSNCMTKTCVEIVENDLGTMISGFANAFDVFAKFQGVDLEIGSRSLGQMTNHESI